ncbi:peptidoglycan-binding domain-containing protein [Streptomyces sp. LaBMicrA B280]|uniref:peptidoglycan-binding domain-containing protein n=1 Tax=Streptomyces sp. LaBMicrA B280 TaxID=3391001 RepID=UPI003BA47E66
MTGEKGTACPECGTPRDAAGAPSCDCAERTAEALRRARTAQAAAAEDFDPLRIRPYVDVGTADGEDPPPAPSPAPPPALSPLEATMPLRPVAGSDVRLFEQAPGEPGPASASAGTPGEPVRRRRFGRAALIAAAGAGAAVVAAAGVALFSYHTPSHDDAAPEVRESVPDVPPPATATPSAHDTSAPSRSTARSAPAPPPSPSPTPTRSAPPSPTPTPGRTPSRAPSPTASTPSAPASTAVLERGDSGPQVVELEYRLWELNLYDGDVNGVYTHPVENAVSTYQLARGIQGDPLGVYGPQTRASLESETSGP